MATVKLGAGEILNIELPDGSVYEIWPIEAQASVVGTFGLQIRAEQAKDGTYQQLRAKVLNHPVSGVVVGPNEEVTH